MARYQIYGSRLNGRDEWVFEADSFAVKEQMIVAQGSFGRKRLKTTIHIPMSSVVYIVEEKASPPREKLEVESEGNEPIPTEGPKKRRGRPPKAANGGAVEPPRRRGRPRKNPLPAPVENVAPRRRGRPPKNPLTAPVAGEANPPRRRGRPRKSPPPTPASMEVVAPRRRGRPRRNPPVDVPVLVPPPEARAAEA